MSVDPAPTRALSSLFGTSTGDVGSVFAGLMGSGNSVSSTAAPKQDDSSSDKHSSPDEEDVTAARAHDIKIVVINSFDQLSDLEATAATQGVTEADLLGAMTIVDASGHSYTWDTFSPDTKFPIQMKFTTEAKQQRSASEAHKGQAAKNTDAQLIIDDAMPAAGSSASAKRRNRKKAAAKKNAAAAKDTVCDNLPDSSCNTLSTAAPIQDSEPELCLPTAAPVIDVLQEHVEHSSSGATAFPAVTATSQAALVTDVLSDEQETSSSGTSALNAVPTTSQATSVTNALQEHPDPSPVGTSALNVVSSTSSGVIGTLPAFIESASSTTAQDCLFAGEHSSASKEHKEEVAVEKTEDTKVVIIKMFEDLNQLEAIASAHGLTEEDLLGDMTIIDASGQSFTWDTFSPDTKFPIQMKFANSSKSVDDLQLIANDTAECQASAVTTTATASQRRRHRAAAKKKAAAASPALGTLLKSGDDASSMPAEEHKEAASVDTSGLSAMFGNSVGEVASLFGPPPSSDKSIGTSLRAQLREAKAPAVGTSIRAQIRTGKVS